MAKDARLTLWTSAAGKGGQHRRASDFAQAPRRPIDTLFAATLINQVSPHADTLARSPYEAPRAVRAGIWRVVKA